MTESVKEQSLSDYIKLKLINPSTSSDIQVDNYGIDDNPNTYIETERYEYIHTNIHTQR